MVGPVPLGQLDQNKIAKSEFRVEHATLSVQDRLLVRKLITQLVQCRSGEESAKAPDFLTALINLARAAGGDPPLPVSPSTTDIEDMQRLVGNEQLVAIKDKAANLESRIKTWIIARDLATKRLPSWQVLERLVRHAGDLPEINLHLDQIEAIRAHRLLLEPTDSVAPIRVTIAGLATRGGQSMPIQSSSRGSPNRRIMRRWRETRDLVRLLDPTQQAGILNAVGLVAPAKPDVSSDEALGQHLDSRPPSGRFKSPSGMQSPEECNRQLSAQPGCWNRKCRRLPWSGALFAPNRRLMPGLIVRNPNFLTV